MKPYNKHAKKSIFFIPAFIVGTILIVPLCRLSADNATITDFGDGATGEAWQADDVRNSAGTNIIIGGTNDPFAGATTDVSQVAAQIDWLNFVGSAGNLGGTQFDTSASASQKSTLSIVNGTSGFLAGSDMLGPSFSATYQWQNNDTAVAGLSLKFGLQSSLWSVSQAGFTATRSGEASWDLVLVFDPTNNGQISTVDGKLYTSNVTADSKFRLFSQAGSGYWSTLGATATTLGIGAGSHTLAEWNSMFINGIDGPTWGSILFDSSANVSNVQFGMGSGNEGALTTLDWAQFSFLNGGDTIDFVDASTWEGATSGTQDFALDSNWSDSAEPSSSQNVVFTENATYTAAVSDNTGARSIGVMNGVVTIDIANEKTLTLSSAENGTLYSASGATLNLAGEGDLVASVLEVGGTTNVAVTGTLDGGADAHPQRDGASTATSRYGIAVLGGGSLTLQDGADITVSQDNLNAGVRVGDSEGTASLTIEDGASLVIGNDTAFASNGLDSNGFFVAGAWGSTGIVNQTGGNFELHDGSFNLGNQGGFGTYTLSGGTATLSGGLHSLGRNTGSRAAGSGTLNIEGGIFTIEGSPNNGNGSFVIGDRDASDTDGSGLVHQTGGTFSVGSGSLLYLGGYGDSTYNLEGGTLEVGGNSLQGNYGSATSDYDFNLQGGTIKIVNSDLTTAVDMNLKDIDATAGVTTSAIDTNGLNATLNGAVTGAGTLSKVGAGQLTLGGTNEFGTLEVAAGTTEITSSTTLTGPAATGDAVITVTGGSTVEVTSGAVLNVLQGQTRVGVGTGVDGTLTVSGGTADLGTATAPVSGDFARTIIGGSGGTGTLNLQSGSVVIGSGASGGEYGSMRVGLGAGSVGVVNQTGGVFDASKSGSLALGQDGGTGTYNLSSGSALIGGSKKTYFHVGRGLNSNGFFNISGDATVDVGVGSGPEDYAFFYVGSLDASAEGTVTQSGTSIMTSEQTLFYIGNDASNAMGTYTISDSAQFISRSNHPSSSGDRIRLGTEEGGTGTFTQTGTSLVDLQNGGKINIVGSTSAYNLNGGTLQVSGVNGIRGTGNFNLGGGTIKVIESDLTTSAKINLTVATTSSIDTNSLNATVQGSMSGAGHIVVFGGGVLKINGTNTNTGTTSISTGTGLAVDGELSGSALTIAEGALLSGSGIIHAATAVEGTLAVGDSLSLLTFTDGLLLSDTSVSEFEFNANSTSGRGFSFDAVDVTGGVLTIDPSATLSLVFNEAGSVIDFEDAFWDSDQSWTLFENDETPTLDSIIFAAVHVSVDSLGGDFGADIGRFSVGTFGNDVILNFTAVPEPRDLRAIDVDDCRESYSLSSTLDPSKLKKLTLIHKYY